MGSIVQSVFLGNATRRPQPLFDLASSVAAMKARVAGIPVYTVANKADEFVLVTGGEVQSFSMCRPTILSATTCITLSIGLHRQKETRSSWDCFSSASLMPKILYKR